MQTSGSGINLIKQFEGEVLKIYLDPIGLPSCGCGHLLTAAEKRQYKVGQPITQAQSDTFLREDLQTAETAINHLVKVPLAQNQFDALASFTLNLGAGALQHSHLLAFINKGDFSSAANEFLKWNKAGGKVLSGLVRRREAEKALFEKS